MKTLRPHGFTLLELMVTLAISGIVIGFAIPGMNQFIKNDRLTSFRNELFTALQYARSTSVQRNQPVIVCVSSNQTSCTAGTFQDGWIVGIDLDDSGTIDNANELLKVQQSIKAKTAEIQFFSDFGTSINFDNRGFSPDTHGRISVCDARGDDFGQVITVSVTGRVGRGDNATCS
jgi:type IV fimbrial biogenesis protein FimT